MRAIVDYLLTFESFRAALRAAGWAPVVVTPRGGGGPGDDD